MSPKKGEKSEKSSPPPTLESIMTAITALTNTVNNIDTKLDNAILRVDKLETHVSNIETKISDINTNMSDVEKNQDFLSSEMDLLKATISEKISSSDHQSAIDKLNSRITQLEFHDRKYNLLFYGLPESDNTDVVVRGFLKDKLELDSTYVDKLVFVNSHRLPGSQGYRGNYRTQPIIVRFALMSERDSILKKTFKLKGSSFVIKVDLPSCLKSQRSVLEGIGYRLRQEGILTRIRVFPLKVILETKSVSDNVWREYKVE